MSSETEKRAGFKITGAEITHDTALAASGVEIVVTQAFGPAGDNLVGLSDVVFDGHPAVTLLVRTPDGEGLVHLSPIHGDDRKAGFTDIAPGTRCELLCPVSKEPLPKVDQIGEAGYYALYLTPRGEKGSYVLLSDVWGHYHSRIIDDFELISDWARD
ncbi:MAG: hypothetical protein KC613_08300 [Myxococcales bacterium]|nr:hypothetical protein [Myxococcales bacterium]MCB9525134.1 hypothetical protein [Myxococcales bacterium]